MSLYHAPEKNRNESKNFNGIFTTDDVNVMILFGRKPVSSCVHQEIKSLLFYFSR